MKEAAQGEGSYESQEPQDQKDRCKRDKYVHSPLLIFVTVRRAGLGKPERGSTMMEREYLEQ
jgi:hypothetical protein